MSADLRDNFRVRSRWGRRRFLQLIQQGLPAVLALAGLPTPLVAVSATSKGIAALRRELRGSVIVRNDAQYEAWRQSMVWQLVKPARCPDVIVQAENESDVRAAIRFARANKLKVVARTGGHNFCGSFLRDGSLLIDVSRLQNLKILPLENQAVAQPGIFGRTLNAELGRNQLAFPTAHCGDVPLGGYLLGGGIGWNSNAWGNMSALNVMAIDAVTADGSLRHASEHQNQELLWAARGGGPAFCGIVTRFYLRCYPLPKAITKSSYVFAIEDLQTFVAMLEDVGRTSPKGVELLAEIGAPPEGLPVVAHREEPLRVCSLDALAFADSAKEARQWLASIASHPAVKRALQKVECRSVTWADLYQGADYGNGRLAADNLWTDSLAEVAQVLEGRLSVASPGTSVAIVYKGLPTHSGAACFASGRFYVGCYPGWDDKSDDLLNRTWLAETMRELQRFSKGGYINEFDRESRPERTVDCWSPDAWKRLRVLRRQFDPDGLFHDFLPNELPS